MAFARTVHNSGTSSGVVACRTSGPNPGATLILRAWWLSLSLFLPPDLFDFDVCFVVSLLLFFFSFFDIV